MNDSLRTNVFVRYSPETIACACISLAARQLQVINALEWLVFARIDGNSDCLQIPLPQKPAWWLLFDAEYKDIQVTALFFFYALLFIMSFYPDYM